jgi:hypothetical protein
VNDWRKFAAVTALIAFVLGPVVLQRHEHGLGPWADAGCASCAAVHGTPPPPLTAAFTTESVVHDAPAPPEAADAFVPLQIPQLLVSPATSPPVVA